MIEWESFENCPNHEACVLYKQASHPGVPSRMWEPSTGDKSVALVVVGEAPGWQEDAHFRCWVGRSGQLLDEFMSQSYTDFASTADVYLMNTCRCFPGTVKNPPDKAITLCKPNLVGDIKKVLSNYKTVALLLLGASAVSCLVGKGGLRKSFACQGDFIDLGDGTLVRAYRTYHPSSLMRKPQQARVLEQHFKLVAQFLRTGQPLAGDKEITYHTGQPCPYMKGKTL